MFKKLKKNKKAQNTAEYAILIALVIGGVTAMQVYTQRALQAKIRDGAAFLTGTTNAIGNTAQYEPYYLTTNYEISRDDLDRQVLTDEDTRTLSDSLRNRASGGFQESTYNQKLFGMDKEFE